MAFIVFVTHQIQDGLMAEAQERIDSNGSRMAVAAGFISRHLMTSTEEENQISTITIWESQNEYENWQEANRKSNVHADKPTPYVGTPVTKKYTQISIRTASS